MFQASGESAARGPARSISAVAVAAVGSAVLFWLVGESLPGGLDLRVAFLCVTFGLLLAVSVGYSWTVDRVWRRSREEARASLATFKEDFVTSLNRDLRSSLTGIVGFAQMIDPSVVGDENAEALNTVITQSVELSRVIDDISVAARLEAGALSLNPERVSVCEEVEAAVAYLKLMGHEVSVECRDATVLVDPEAFRHVLRNLLVNAHTHGEAPVAVRGHSFGDRYICQVVDRGPGLSPGAEMALTDELSLQAVNDALGLGLAIAQALADRMGSELSYRRVRGESHLILTLPVVREQTGEGAAVHRFTLPRIVRPHVREETPQPAA
ncbi:MAG TPA: HAMP domain-containing sensor histidine kinase [Acidimicrobiia bacterium]